MNVTPESDHYSGVSERQELLESFADDPENESIWYEAISLAEAQTETIGIAGTIEAEELALLAERVNGLNTSVERYALMAESAPDGRAWFDVLETFSDPTSEAAIGAFIDHYFNQGHEGERIGLDIGVGSGKTLQTLSEHVDTVVGIDVSPEMAALARSRVPDANVAVAQAEKLPFMEGSVDVITLNGVLPANSRDSARDILSEGQRVLKPGGVMVHIYNMDRADGEPDDSAKRITQTAKSALSDMIVDATSDKFRLQEPSASADDIEQYCAELGLDCEYVQFDDEAGNSRMINVIAKQG